MKTSYSVLLLLAIFALSGMNGCKSKNNDVPALQESPEEQMETGETDAASISVEGAKLEMMGGAVQLDVPAGARFDDTEITVTRLPDVEGMIPGMNYQFGPDGLTFAKPVRLTLQLPPDFSKDDLANVTVTYSKGDRELEDITMEVGKDGTVTAEIIGF